jgi:hypothetical protein
MIVKSDSQRKVCEVKVCEVRADGLQSHSVSRSANLGHR